MRSNLLKIEFSAFLSIHFTAATSTHIMHRVVVSAMVCIPTQVNETFEGRVLGTAYHLFIKALISMTLLDIITRSLKLQVYGLSRFVTS